MDNQDTTSVQEPSSQGGTTQNTSVTSSPGLTLIGADLPSRVQATRQSFQPTEIESDQLVQPQSEANTLAIGGDAVLKAGQYEEQGAQGRLNSILQGNDATQKSIAAAQGAAIDMMKANVQQSKQRDEGIQSLLKMGMGFLQNQQNQKAGQELIAATQEVEKFKTEITSHGLMEQGIAPARQQLASILSKYKNIPTNELQSLLKEGYAPIQQFAERQQTMLYDTAKQQRAAASEIPKNLYLIQASSTLSALGNVGNTDIPGTLNQLQTIVQQVTNDPKLDTLAKTEIIGSLYGEARKNISSKDVAGQAGLQHLQDGLNYLNDEAKINEWIRQGHDDKGNPVSPEMGSRLLEASRLANRQSTTASGTSYDYNTKQSLAYQQQQQEQIRLNQTGITNALDTVKMSAAQIGVLTWEAINNPEVYANWKNQPGIKDSGLAKTIVQNADDWKQGQTFLAEQGVKVQQAKESLAKYSAETVESLINKSRTATPQQLQELSAGDAAILGLLKASQQRPLTQDEMSQIMEARLRVENQMAEVIKAYDVQAQQHKAKFAPLGLYGSAQEIQTNIEKNKGLVQSTHDAYQQAIQQGTIAPGGNNYYNQGGYSKPNAPFEQSLSGAYGQMANPVSYAQGMYHGKPTPLPFQRGSQTTIYENYGQDRGSHTHAGVDIPVPTGTKALAMVNGRINNIGNDPSGYGTFVDVLGSDGMLYRYAHLSATSVHVGQTVAPGVSVGLTGSSGRSEGPHLHFEIRNPSTPYGFNGTVDPIAYLQANVGRQSSTFQPRGNTSHQYAPSNQVTQQQQYFPANALPVPGGYLLNGKFYQSSNNTTPQDRVPYSASLPIRNGYMSNDPKDYRPNDPNANYGYEVFAQDKQAARALAQVSTKFGIPAVWLADVMASESSHDHTRINGDGCVGLIQMCPGSQMGYTAQQIASMSRSEQILKPVNAYLADVVKTIGKIRSPQELHLAIFGGAGAVLKLRDNPDYNPSDSNISRKEYIRKMLGTSRGRHYET
jgi:murein DD-endopeptidase MepM/ murein hydrolase activator NlpD